MRSCRAGRCTRCVRGHRGRGRLAAGQPADQKIKKDGGPGAVDPDDREPDILATVGGLPDQPYCVGFAAESHDLARQRARKLARKGVPLVVGNIGPGHLRPRRQHLLLVDADGVQPRWRRPQAQPGAQAGAQRNRRDGLAP